MTEVLRHVEADAASADDGHRTADVARTADHIDVGNGLAMIDPRNGRYTGHDAGREHDLIEFRHPQIRSAATTRAQLQLHARASQLRAVVAQRLVKFLLARDALGEIELPADFARGVEQVTLWPRCAATTAQARPAGPAPTTRCALGRVDGVYWNSRLVAGARIDETARHAD